MKDVSCNLLTLPDHRNNSEEQLEKFAKDRYFAQLGELIKSSELEAKVKVERRGSVAVISIEGDHDIHYEEHQGSSHPEGNIPHEQDGFEGRPFDQSQPDSRTLPLCTVFRVQNSLLPAELQLRPRPQIGGHERRRRRRFGHRRPLLLRRGRGVQPRSGLRFRCPGVSLFTNSMKSYHERCFLQGFLDANGQRLPAGDIEEVCILVNSENQALFKRCADNPKVIVQVAAARYCQSGSLTSRLGHSLDVVDVNGDSILDVIVGAPGSEWDILWNNGNNKY